MLEASAVDQRVTDPAFRSKVENYTDVSSDFYARKLDFERLRSWTERNPDAPYRDVLAYCDEFFTYDKIKKILAHERALADEEPYYSSVLQPIEGKLFSGFVLLTTDVFNVVLMYMHGFETEIAKRRTGGDRRTLAFSGLPSMLKMYEAENFAVRTWSVPAFDDEFDISSAALPVTDHGTEEIAAGQTRVFEPGETFEYVCATGGHALALQVQMHRHGSPLTLELDVDTKELVSTSAPSQEPTRLQMLATMMRMFGREDAAEEVAKLTRHDLHYVRWHAVRELVGLDIDAALPILRDMAATDPQASVRRAAAATLDFLQARNLAA